MSTNDIETYYVAGLHALRSASEQGAAKAKLLAEKADNAELKAIIKDYGTTAAKHQEQIVGFMDAVGTKPNDFKDRVMEGVGNGTDEMLKAAKNATLIDMGVISGSSTGAQYYANAFAGQLPTAEALGLDDHVKTWKAMAAEWQAIEKRLGKAGQNAVDGAAKDKAKAA